MITKKITSIAFIIAIAAMFVSSSAFVSPILAKTNASTVKGNTGTSSNSKGNMGSAQQDYKDFQKCLSNGEGTKGFATQQEIKNCYNQIYTSSTTGSSTTGSSSTGTSSGQ